MFAQGDLRLLLLALIADKPSHGYDLIRTIEARFGGTYAPSPGTIYPTLTLLEEQDLIVPEEGGGSKKSYRVTAAGQKFLSENAEQVQALMTRVDIMASAAAPGPMPESVMHAITTLRHAIMSKMGLWTPQEEARVRQVLEQAAKEIVSGSTARHDP
jgi:DNA-binding PadR family transcriptional regulator